MRRTGVIADDFTGATDIAMAYAARGHRAVVVTASGPIAVEDGVDVVVVALKSRTAPVDHAIAASLDALERLRAVGCERFVSKYCSTFDSTDRGNIGPVLDALRGATGARRVVVAPAFPENGRTVYQGHLFVWSDLLEHSPMRHHPLTPMTRSRLRDLLAPQTTGTVGEVGLRTVRQGADALRAAIDAADADAVVVDAVEDADLETLAAATRDDVLVSGAAGVALGVEPGDADPADEFDAPVGRSLVLSGSASGRTREQLAHALAAGLPVAVVDPAAAVDAEVDRLAAWVLAQDPGVVPVVTSLGAPDAVPVDDPEVSARVERILAGVAEATVEAGAGGAGGAGVAGAGVVRLLVAGGETSGAVVERLGVDALRIGPRISAGVCWAAATDRRGTQLAVALKSGNFGAPDMFTSAWGVLG